jgi:oligopeptide/dipeptide ABC transporter ATP-binding protein
MMENVLEVKGLQVTYHTSGGTLKAVNDVSFTLNKEERLGLVGESGSGKTTLATALMRSVREPGKIDDGEILLDGKDLLQLSDEEMRHARSTEISMIPQGAMNSLNPVMRIQDQMIDTLRDHGVSKSKSEFRKWAEDLLVRVGLPSEVASMYPHELSGGMKQRVAIATGISLQPKVIIADEPTSALDVVVQREVMETLRQAQQDLGAAVVLIGHDMGLMAQFADRIGVMYAGKLVEIASVWDIFEKPQHPYTQLLIASLPSLEEKEVFKGIPGRTPSLLNPPTGCGFHPRCPQAIEQCSQLVPVLQELENRQMVSCHLYDKTPGYDDPTSSSGNEDMNVNGSSNAALQN